VGMGLWGGGRGGRGGRVVYSERLVARVFGLRGMMTAFAGVCDSVVYTKRWFLFLIFSLHWQQAAAHIPAPGAR